MFGENIKRIRTSKAMKLSDLANKCGISMGYLSDIENGIKTNPSLDTLSKIAEVLEVTLVDLVKDKEIDIQGMIENGELNEGLVLAYIIKASESDEKIKRMINQALGKDPEIKNLKLNKVSFIFINRENGEEVDLLYDFQGNKVSRVDPNKKIIEQTSIKIENPDIRAIARAGEKLSLEEAAELRKFAERLFPNAFKKQNS